MALDLTPGVSHVADTEDGTPIQRIVLSDGTLTVAVLTLGAILQDVRLAGVAHALTLGTDHIPTYLGPLSSCGSLIGPVVNRISGAQAALSGKTYQFEKSPRGDYSLHGGQAGTHHKVWEIDSISETSATLTLNLPDGEGGFPGNRAIAARFSLIGDGTLELRIAATTDASTWINIANHSYWNLDGTDTYAGHTLTVAADRYCVSDAADLATGEVRDVADTPFDFRNGLALSPGEDVKFDVNLCLSDARRPLTNVLTLTGASGVSLSMATTEPGVQIYDGNGYHSDGQLGHNGAVLGNYAGLAIEPQCWPDAPNQPAFPSIVVHPTRAYEQISTLRFSA